MSCSGSITITTSDDASQLRNCVTYDGDVTISSEASGQISIDGIGSITGDLRCGNATQLTSISADSLQTIGGIFDLQELQIMITLAFSSLDGVNSINWIALPALQALNFGGQGVTRANNVYISNTGLTDLTGIGLTGVGMMNINNNQYLKTINVVNLVNFTQGITIGANGINIEVEFPNLESAANLTFRNVSSLALPSLTEVAGSLGIYASYMQSLSMPNLTSTGNSIAIVDSASSQNLSFPSLETIGGGLFLTNNTKLETIVGLDALVTIDGSLNLYGTFDQISFGSIQDIRGGVNVYTSSSSAAICDLFNNAKKAQVIKGSVTCATSNNGLSETTTGSGPSSATSASSPSGSSSPSNSSTTADGKPSITGGAIAGIAIGVLAIIAIIGMIFFFMRRRKGKTASGKSTTNNDPRPGHHQLPLGGHHEKAELQSSPNHGSELSGTAYPGVHAHQATGAYQDQHRGEAEMSGEARIAELNGTSYAHNATNKYGGSHGAPESITGNLSGNSSAPGDMTSSESTPFIRHQREGDPTSEIRDHGAMGLGATGAPPTEPSYSRAQSTRIPNLSHNTGAPSNLTPAHPNYHYDAVM